MRTRAQSDGVGALVAALRAEGGTIADVLLDPQPSEPATASGAPQIAASEPAAAPGPAQVAAGGPRARGHEAEYELLIEMILEGARLHYGRPRVVRPDDPDLALLLGDQLYALGLARLAALGDLEAVNELADVISLVAQAHGSCDPELAAAVWDAGAAAIGWGASSDHAAAKELARAGDAGAAGALRAAAAQAREGS